MRKIISQNDKHGNATFYLIDTDKATLIYEEKDDKTYCQLYKTTKKHYFKVFKNGEVTLLTDTQAKEYLAGKDPDEFISAFGNVADW